MQVKEGGCLCGDVRYRIEDDPKAVAICHCSHCQRQSGSLFSTNVVVGQDRFVLEGQTRTYEDRGDSGLPVWRHFCGRCGSPIFTVAESIPGKVVVKAGTLDQRLEARPAVELYTARSCAWWPPLEGVQRFPQGRGS